MIDAPVQPIRIGNRWRDIGARQKKFAAIEGLRGWLAWTVVFCHAAQLANIFAHGLGRQLVLAGNEAVLIFIVISGFVITHLILTKRESYAAYITRRFFRIFPLFAVTCILGYFTANLLAQNISHLPWANEANFYVKEMLLAEVASTKNFWWQHVIAHATMLHGAISGDLLPYSSYTLNRPAWSLSLEWQFYLLAPLIVGALVSASSALVLASTALCLSIAYNIGLFGYFESPSFLPGAIWYFAAGIAGRFLLQTITATAYSKPLFEACGILFSNKIALYFGSRSYSTFLIHLPIIAVLTWAAIDTPVTHSKTVFFLYLIATGIPLVILASEILYRFVEQPGIRFGAKMARTSEAQQ